jgi:acylpyruvate hydrolase
MKIICIGRNYALHARELNNPVPESPVVFMKPSTALLNDGKPFYYPDFSKNIHYELEVVLRIAKNGRHVQPDFARSYYEACALGIDFTARDLQKGCKEKGHPWEIAKAFDHSAPVGRFVGLEELPDPEAIEFKLLKNGAEAQLGNTSDLLFPFDELIVYVSKFFKLQMGDLLFTGTPAGVGPVAVGDVLEGYLTTKAGPTKLLHCEVK